MAMFETLLRVVAAGASRLGAARSALKDAAGKFARRVFTANLRERLAAAR